MGAVLILLRVTLMALALLLALVLHGLWCAVRAPSPWPRLLLGAIGRIAGTRRRIIGTPLRRDIVFLANHLSWLDILTLAGATGTAFVAKGELAHVPLIGWLCRLNRTVFVARGDRMGVGAQVAAIRDTLADGWPIAIFPEGTTGDGRALLPFKTALLSVLEPAPPGVRVQPVTIDYGPATAEIAWQHEAGLANVRRILSRRRGLVATLTFHAPSDPADHPGRKASAAAARERMATGGRPAAAHADLNHRRPVWTALSNLFLDTDVALLRAGDARVLAASPYPLAAIERILVDEVAPVCGDNLWSLAGEWAGFDADWLEERILARGERPGRRMRRMWPDWQLLRAEVERIRLRLADGVRAG